LGRVDLQAESNRILPMMGEPDRTVMAQLSS